MIVKVKLIGLVFVFTYNFPLESLTLRDRELIYKGKEEKLIKSCKQQFLKLIDIKTKKTSVNIAHGYS